MSGSGMRAPLGRSMVQYPPSVSYTQSTSRTIVRVETEDAVADSGSAAASPPATPPTDAASATSSEDVIAAVMHAEALRVAGRGARDGDAGSPSVLQDKRVAAREIMDAADAAMEGAAERSGGTLFVQQGAMQAWRYWLLRALQRRGHVFPGPDHPPLDEAGCIDMPAIVAAQSAAAESAANAVPPPYDPEAPTSYVALTASTGGGETAWVWPQGVRGAACWYCAHPFAGPPTSVPVEVRDDGTYVMRGIFCSVPCAVSHIYTEGVQHTQAARIMWLSRFLLDVLEGDIAAIPALMRKALPREALQLFGGSMDIDTWREASHCTALSVRAVVPPYVPDTVMLRIQAQDAVVMAAFAAREEGVDGQGPIADDAERLTVPARHVDVKDALRALHTDVLRQRAERAADAGAAMRSPVTLGATVPDA